MRVEPNFSDTQSCHVRTSLCHCPIMHEQVSQPTWCGRHGTAAASSQHLSSSRTFLATPSATLSCSRTRLPLLDSTSSCPTFWEGSRCVAHRHVAHAILLSALSQQACGQHGHGFHPPVEAHVVPMLLCHQHGHEFHPGPTSQSACWRLLRPVRA
jgi:hypothetical protein